MDEYKRCWICFGCWIFSYISYNDWRFVEKKEILKMNSQEEKELREELAYRRKWDKIHKWTKLTGSSILLIIISWALIKRLSG